MNDSTKNSLPDELYREYQTSRDNIPSGIYHEIVSRASQAQHEDNIHLLLQQAKLLEHGRDESSTSHTARPHWSEKVTRLLSFNSGKAWGTAFASLALAIVVIPLVMNNTGPTYGDVAHLNNCDECARYIADASVITRSSTPGLTRLEPETRIAAKLGRISTNLKIAASLEDDDILAASVKELTKLSSSVRNPNLGKLLNAESPAAVEFISIIESLPRSTRDSRVFDAAQALQIASITLRSATGNEQHAEVSRTLVNAATAFAEIDNRNSLQSNVLEQLESTRSTLQSGARLESNRLLELYSLALQSLGA